MKHAEFSWHLGGIWYKLVHTWTFNQALYNVAGLCKFIATCHGGNVYSVEVSLGVIDHVPWSASPRQLLCLQAVDSIQRWQECIHEECVMNGFPGLPEPEVLLTDFVFADRHKSISGNAEVATALDSLPFWLIIAYALLLTACHNQHDSYIQISIRNHTCVHHSGSVETRVCLTIQAIWHTQPHNEVSFLQDHDVTMQVVKWILAQRDHASTSPPRVLDISDAELDGVMPMVSHEARSQQ